MKIAKNAALPYTLKVQVTKCFKWVLKVQKSETAHMHPSPNLLDGEAPSLSGEVRVNARDFSVCVRKQILALYIYRPLNSMSRSSFPYTI